MCNKRKTEFDRTMRKKKSNICIPLDHVQKKKKKIKQYLYLIGSCAKKEK